MGCTETKEQASGSDAPPQMPGGSPEGRDPRAGAPSRNTEQDRGRESRPQSPYSKKSGSDTQTKKGTKLLDSYVLGKLLGQGAFGVVYKCRRKGTQHDYAVKMIDQVETPLNEIEKEVQMLVALKHPTVIALHEVFYEKVFVCMVLELYKGGDMIQGMMAHWKKKGMIPMSAVQHLTKQMWDSVAFLHSRNYCHRDVKGDNFMMDLPEVENPANRIYLSDFGTVVELKPDQHMSQKCGTKNYWSPEFFKQKYGQKVDCWAVGVIMFGFFSGKFPFSNEQEANNKKLKVHPRVGTDGEKLLLWAFARDEKKRCQAAEAAVHPFVVKERSIQEVQKETSQSLIDAEVKEFGANAGVKERRRELVDRLVQNAKRYQQDMETPKPGRSVSASSFSAAGNSVVIDQLDADTFSIMSKYNDRSMTFKWTPMKKAQHHLDAIDQCRHLRSGAVNYDVSNQSIRRQLEHHDISLANFGLGKAKPIEEFIEEIQMGKAKLFIDATRPKFLVRAVDVVLARIFVKTSSGRKYLVERQEKYPNGLIRETGQLPGHKRAPHENAIQGAERLVQEMLQIEEGAVKFDYDDIDCLEQGEDSPSYPGVHTVYIKHTVRGALQTYDDKILDRLGLGESGNSIFEVEDDHKYVRTFQWMTAEDASAGGIQLMPKNQEEDISALVYPPVGLSEDDLFAYLGGNNVDVSKWGATSVADFSEELVKGESALLRQDNGRVVRVVDIVVLKLLRHDEEGQLQVLREVEEKVQEKTWQLDRLPGLKRRADEHPFAAARRLISKYLQLDSNMVSLDPVDVKIVQEEQDSKSYPGLLSVYRKRYMTATLHNAPVGRIDTA